MKVSKKHFPVIERVGGNFHYRRCLTVGLDEVGPHNIHYHRLGDNKFIAAMEFRGGSAHTIGRVHKFIPGPLAAPGVRNSITFELTDMSPALVGRE